MMYNNEALDVITTLVNDRRKNDRIHQRQFSKEEVMKYLQLDTLKYNQLIKLNSILKLENRYYGACGQTKNEQKEKEEDCCYCCDCQSHATATKNLSSSPIQYPPPPHYDDDASNRYMQSLVEARYIDFLNRQACIPPIARAAAAASASASTSGSASVFGAHSYVPPHRRWNHLLVVFNIDVIAKKNKCRFPEIEILPFVLHTLFRKLELKSEVVSSHVKPSKRQDTAIFGAL